MARGVLWLAAITLLTAGTPYDGFPELTGPYFGQQLSEGAVAVFAPGILKPPNGYHGTVVFNRAGDEAWWTAMSSGVTYFSRRDGGVWSRPVRLLFDDEYGVREPMLSPDETRFYFLSRRPLTDDPVERERIWFVERDGDGWSAPQLIDRAVAAHPTHWQFSFNGAGDLYFMSEIERDRVGQDVYVARWNGAGFGEPERVEGGVNTGDHEFCPFVAPDERYLLFTRSPASWGRADLFVSFREEGGWGEAVDLGSAINSKHNETCPVVTADGRYLFFLRVSAEMNDAFWTRATVIDAVRP